jgi:hypothetical protein
MSWMKSRRYLEYLVSLVLISTVVLVFFVQINKMVVIAEEEMVQQTLSTVRLGMQFHVLNKIVGGEVPVMDQYADTNPLDLLIQPPANYAGEFSAEESAGVAPGKWYYDKSASQLVYRIANYPLLGEAEGFRELRYRLRISDMKTNPFNLQLLPVEEET